MVIRSVLDAHSYYLKSRREMDQKISLHGIVITFPLSNPARFSSSRSSNFMHPSQMLAQTPLSCETGTTY